MLRLPKSVRETRNGTMHAFLTEARECPLSQALDAGMQRLA